MGERACEGGRHEVVTLCGSTRFKDDFQKAQESLTLAGKLVISLGFFEHAEGKIISPETEALLADIHRQRIDMSDAVFVINRDDYIGKSTAAEIEYARAAGKAVTFMFPHGSQTQTGTLRNEKEKVEW